jgi:hypothetical protein
MGIDIGRAPRSRGGLPFLLFRGQDGCPVPPGRRFLKPPYNPARPVFPGPVGNLGFLLWAFPSSERFKRRSVSAPAFPGLPQASPPAPPWRYAGFIKPATTRTTGEPPRVQSPFPNFGVASVGET